MPSLKSPRANDRFDAVTAITHRTICNIVAVFLILATLHESSVAQGLLKPAYVRNGPGILLLNNGEVIKGNVLWMDKQVQIRLDDTATITLPADRVSYVGESIEDLYLFQTRMINAWSYSDHLKIARWCARQGMFGQAMPHYTYLKSEIPERAEFKKFDAEFRNQMLADVTMKQALVAAGVRSSGDDITGAKTNATLTSYHNAQNHSDANSTNAFASGNRVAPPAAMMRLSVEDQQTFLHDIQPVLVTSCARSGCHGTLSNNSFGLRDTARFDSNKAYRENLETFSNYIVQHGLDKSASANEHPLLQKSVLAHGNRSSSPLDVTNPRHQRYLEALRSWIAKSQQTSEQPPAASINPIDSTTQTGKSNGWWTPPPIAAPAFAPLPSSPIANAVSGSDPLAASKQSALADQAGSAGVLDQRQMQSLESMIARLETIEKERAKLDDPLDPNEFNRRYGNTPQSKSSDNKGN